MSNEVTVASNENALNVLDTATSIDSAELNRVGASDYIPIMSVAYSMSESVDKGIAKPGEFVLAKQSSLGAEIEIVPLAYRLHVALINKESFSFVESQYTQMGEKSSEAYLNLCKMTPPKDHEIQEGADLFVYIPSVDSFASIFMKKTLAKAVQPIWSTGKGGRAVKIRTNLEKNRTGTRKWYSIAVSGTAHALEVSKLEGVTKDIKMDVNLFTKYLNQFRNPPRDVAETVADDAKDEGIER